MQQTTRVKDGQTAGATADGGPSPYAPPVVSGVQPPTAPQPQPAQSKTGWSFEGMLGLLLLSVVARGFADLSPLPKLQTHTIIGAFTMISLYWTMPKPREGFWRWTLKSVGVFLNLYVGCVAVPESLLGLLPTPLAFGLPTFVTLSLILYSVFTPTSNKNNKTSQLWQLLLWAAGVTALWVWYGPGVIK